MTAARVLGSVAIAWTSWLLGHALIVWKGFDYYRSVVAYQDRWSGTAVLALLVLVAGALLLALATTSLVLSWVGLFTVGVVQVLMALVTGFAWSRAVYTELVPSWFGTSLSFQHLAIGVHLLLGGVLIGLAAATLVRSRGGARGVVPRVLSFGSLPLLAVALLLLALGGARNIRSLQVFGGVDAVAVLMLLGALVLVVVATAVAGASGSGPTLGGGIVLLVGVVSVIDPTMLFLGGSQLGFGLTLLFTTGALLVLGAVLTVGGLMVSVGALLARRGSTSSPAPPETARTPPWPQTHQEL